jgi:hypothetical protein
VSSRTAGFLLASLVARTVTSPARAIHRGYDAPFGSYSFMVSLRLAEVTALGSDSTTKLYAGFTSIPVERNWIRAAIRSLRMG